MVFPVLDEVPFPLKEQVHSFGDVAGLGPHIG